MVFITVTTYEGDPIMINLEQIITCRANGNNTVISLRDSRSFTVKESIAEINKLLIRCDRVSALTK